MLIPSDRHRPEDLELWRDLEEADLAHYPVLERSGKIQQSIREIVQFHESGPCYAAFSGGKDSLVMLSLIAQAELLESIPVVWFCAVPKVNPDVLVVIGEVAKLFNIAIEARPYDSPVPGKLTREETEEASTKNFLKVCNQAASNHGKRILGLRMDESGVRKIRFRHWGLTTKNCCSPLGWWSLQDVYSYAAYHHLPLCSVYGMLGGGRWPRHALRVDALMGANGDQFGRAEWEADYYGDILRRLEAQSRPSRG